MDSNERYERYVNGVKGANALLFRILDSLRRLMYNRYEF